MFDTSINRICGKCKKPYLSAGTILDKTVNTHGNFTGISNHSNFVPNSKKVHSAQKVSAIRKIFDVSDKMERFTKPGACATLTAERTLRGKGRERWNSMKKGKMGKKKTLSTVQRMYLSYVTICLIPMVVLTGALSVLMCGAYRREAAAVQLRMAQIVTQSLDTEFYQ